MTKTWLVSVVAIVVIALTPLGSARAELTRSASDGFTVRHTVDVPLDATRAFARLVRVQDWWDGAHTYSGDAGRLRLRAAPGGCFCERLKSGGFVEHLRVTYADPGKALRLEGGLGPLAALGAHGVMTFSVKAAAAGASPGASTRVTLSYIVTGPVSTFGDVAAAVDGVLGQALARFGKGVDAVRTP
jgi:hypothetical protein